MILSSWLASLFGRLAKPQFQRSGRIRKNRQPQIPMAVESLEQRKMLTALNVFVNGVLGGTTIHVTEETSFAHYPSFSKPQGTFIGANITVTDPNAGFAYTPGNTSITGGNNPSGFYGPAFRINQGTGVDKVWINDPTMIDLQKNATFSLVFTATDGTNTGTATLNIIVDSANPNIIPVIPQFPYQNIGNIDAMGNNSNSNFTGGIQSTGDATDANSQSNANNSLLPGLDSPTGTGVNLLRVKENSPLGTVIGPVVADTPEEPYNHSVLTYTLVGTIPGFNSSDPAIAIDAFSGKITITDPSFFNYEALRTANAAQGNLGENPFIFDANGISGYTVPGVVLDALVRVQDQVGNSNFTTQPDGSVTNYSHVYIRVLDVGEIPPDVSHATTSLSVNETTSTPVPNASVVGTSVGFFDINSGVPNFYIPAGGSVRIANTATNLGLSTPEGQQRYSFFIVGGNTGNAFTIDPTTGEITVATANIDYETLNNYTLQIKVVSDNGPLNPNAGTVPSADALGAVPDVVPLSTVASLHITINDVNEQTAIPDNQNFTIPEGSVDGTIVGAVVATDPDLTQPNGLGKLVYSIVSGNSVTINGTVYSGIFQIDSNTGVISVANSTGQTNAAVLNYINQPTFALTIQAVDRGDLITAANKSVVVNLSKVDSTPPVFADKSFTINENQPNGTLVGTVTATAGQSDFSVVAYTITAGNTGNAFAISNSGQITVNTSSAVNFEVNPIFNLTVMATDDGTPSPLSSTATVTINLNNVNEQISMLPQSFSVAENSAAGTLVNTIFTSDPDNLVANVQGQSFVITGGNTGNAFAIDAQGHITIANPAAVDFEVNPIFSLAVTVTDTGVPSTSMSNTITINLINQNDAPIVGTQNFNVQEHAVQGTTVGTVVATDQDLPAQKLTYAITGGNLGTVSDPAFNIDPNTGKITVNDPGLIDYATTPTIPLTVTVTDDGSNGTPTPWAPKSTSATVNVLLQDVQEPQLADQNPPSIPEYVTGGTTQIGTVVTTDAATHGTAPYTYSILSGNDNLVNGQTGAFAIDNTGKITVANPLALDFETQPTFTLQILAVDSHVNPQLGDTATITINLTNVNEAPTLSAIEPAPLSYTENATTPVTSTIVATDVDSLNAQGAVIQITGNYLKTEDSLGFTTMGNITGVWDSTAGTMTLSGTDTLANYQAALRSVTYNDSSDNPNVLIRTVSYTITDDGGLASNTVTRNINVNPLNDAPTLSGIEGSPLGYIENGVTPVTSAILATDPDSANASGATIQITGAYVSTQDSLVFTNTLNITGTWNSSTGTMTLSGSDTFANYQAALRAVKYSNSSNAPNVTQRTVSFTITDSSGAPSNTVTRGITITPQNDPPKLISIESTAAAYTENANSFATIPVTSTIVATDPDSPNLQGATVQITGHYVNGQDQLNFTTLGTITGSWNPANGTMTLSGTDTLTNYRLAIRSITYQNLSHNPDTTARTLTFQVTDSSGASSATVTRNINLTAVNNAPVLSSVVTNIGYTEGTGPQVINGSITVSDVDSTKLSKGTITITTNYDSTEDVLGFVPNAATMGNITISSNAGGVLTLTSVGATATLAQWQAAFRAVTYNNTGNSLTPPARTVTFVADDGSAVNNLSNTLTSGINITAIFPPVLAGTNNKTYIEQTPAIAIDSGITVSDPGTPTLASATIKITNFVSGQDVLGFVPNAGTMGNIAIQSNSGGVLTLTSSGSTATLAQWQNALRAVTYQNSSLNPTTTTRTVTFQVSNGKAVNALSNTLSTTVAISPVNDAPVLSGIESTALSYVELSTNVAITSSLAVSDVDSANMSGAVIQITGNFQSGQDQLQFKNTSNITGVYNAFTGVLTLTGADTVANYQAALRSITFYDSSNNPSTAQRTVTFSVTDDGGLPSNTLTRKINITPVDNAPTLTGIETTPLQYTENTPPNYSANNTTVISTAILASDPDSLNMSGATVKITGNYQMNQDFLKFTAVGAITGSFDVATGTLTLTGTDTLAHYNTVLHSVSYFNLQDNPVTFTRTVAYTITDDLGLPSNTVTRFVTVTAVNDPPLLTMVDSGPLTYTEDAAAKAIVPSILAADPDSDNLKSATIQITGNYVNGKDTLAFANTANITGSWNPATGTLTLTGVDSVSNYRTALRSVTFFNQYDAAVAPTRTVSFTVTDQAGLVGNTVSRNVSITTVSDAAILSGIETTPHVYKANDPYTPPTPITSSLTITDYDSASVLGATIQITSGYSSGHDRLGFSAPGTAITGSFNTTTGVLTLSGTDTIAHYQAALQSVIYYTVNGPASTATRTVTFQTTDNTHLKSNFASRFVTTTTTNAPPSISLNSSGPLSYTEGDPGTPIAPSVTITDTDSPNIQNATIKITGNYQPGQDSLQFTSFGNIITSGFSTATATMVLTGSNTLANYVAALKTVKFIVSGGNPSSAQRTISLVVSDGLLSSNIVTQVINVTPVDNAPVLVTNATGALAYQPANGAVAVTPGMGVTDADNSTLTSATISISGGYVRNSDALSFTAVGNITGSFNVQTGVLTLTGVDSLSNYRTVLQSIKYKFTGNAISSTRTVSFSVSDGTLSSAAVTRNINVTP